MEASAAVQSRLIGAIFVEKNLITAEQLEEALQLQETTGDRFGEIVVSRFGVGRLELAGVLAEQWAKYEVADRDVPPAGNGLDDQQVVQSEPQEDEQVRRPLGEISIEQGFITSEQLDAALETQRELGGRIGEILVEQGSLTQLELASALAEQWSALQKLRPPGPVVEPQPWQNGSVRTTTAEVSSIVSDLVERLRAVEQTARTMPWQEDLNRVTSELRAAVVALEQRLDAVVPSMADEGLAAAVAAIGARIDALESVSVSTELDSLRQELEVLATRPATVEGLADLRAAVERLEGRNDPAAEIAQLAGEITALDRRLDELAGVGELTDKLAAVAGQAEVAQAGLQGLSRRVDDLAGLEHRLDELTARLQTEEVIEELRSALAGLAMQSANDDRGEQGAEIASLVARLDELAAHVGEVAQREMPDVFPRLDELSARIEDVAAAIPVVEPDVLAAKIESLEAMSRTGSGALEHLAAEIGELESRTQLRLDALSSREPDLVPIAELRARVDELVAAVEREPDTASLDEVRARVDELSAAVDRDSDSAAIDELRLRVNLLAATVERESDRSALDVIRARLEELTTAVEHGEEVREELQRAADSTRVERESFAQAVFARVEEVAATVPREDELAEIRARLDELAARPTFDRSLQERVDGVAAQLEGLDALHADDALTTATRLAGLEAAIGAVAPLERRIDAGLDAQSVETAALRAQVEELQESAANQAALKARLESMFTERFDVLANRITDEIAAVRAETVSLEEQIGELQLRHRDAREAKTTAERLAVRMDELVGLRAGDAEAAQVAAAELGTRVEAVAASLHAEVAEARGAVDGLAEQSVAAAAKVERALRKELRGVAERLEESDAGKLEALEASVAKLKRRLEKQAALGEEQVRVTERALRKGLASLGERLADTESAYGHAGKAMRRSIERLGAAVVEADARMAHQIPVSEAEGCVAFAPTAVGYRLIELPGAPPEVGSTIELDTIDGALVVTGYGRSPLPLDSRACAYLDRA